MKRIPLISYILALASFPLLAWAGADFTPGASTGAGTGDMTKAVYDTGNNSAADVADTLAAGGKAVDVVATAPVRVNGGANVDNILPGTDADVTFSLAAVTESIYWSAAAFRSDGTQCANPALVTLNSGPRVYSVICADNDGSTINGHIVMPDAWDAGTLTFELEYLQSAADTNVLNADVACQCRGAGEAVNDTWGTEQAIDDAAVSGSNKVDQTTSAATTCDGTCAAGDTLFWRLQVDATGTTTAVATLHFLGMKMEYVSNASGD